MKKMILAVCFLAFAPLAMADTPPAIPATPAAVDEVISIQPFTLDEGFEFDWSKERPLVKSGVILVLKVDPALVYPRQIAEPVLYVGDTTAQRMNFGNESGYVVALVPGEVDLATTPIWFGSPELPERVDRAMVSAERKLAEQNGIKAVSARAAQTAVANGGERIHASNMTELLDPIATLIEDHSPAENELVESLRFQARSAN
jgi:hypothetical protein